MSSDKTAEPSMDEILSSIRKIITEDPTTRPSPTGSTVPLPPAMKADYGSPSNLPPPPRPPVLKPAAVDDVLDELSKDVRAMRSAVPPAPPLPASTPPSPTAERAAAKPVFGARDLDTESKSVPVGDKRAVSDLGAVVPPRLDTSSPVTTKADLLPHERLPDPGFGRASSPSKPDGASTGILPSTPGARMTPAGSPQAGGAPGQLNGNHFGAGSSSPTQAQEARPNPTSDMSAKASSATPATPAANPSAVPAMPANAPASGVSSVNGAAPSAIKAAEPVAAKSAAMPEVSPSPTSSAAVSKPLSGETPVARPSPAVSATVAPARPANASGPTSASQRTMEETVVELLRPLLRQWLDANMPRILEKTLKAELADEAKKKD